MKDFPPKCTMIFFLHGSEYFFIEFAMELQIPSCALRGLNMDDIIFNSGMEGDCGAVKNDNGTFFNWKISYNDCGTIRNVKSNLIRNH